MAKRITKDEEMAILKAIEKGESVNQVAKKFKRSPNTVSKYAKKNNANFAYARPKKANEASQFYNKEKRMNLLKMGFEKHKELLPEIENLRDLKDWDMGVAILIDKQRLEEGQATEITKGEMKNTNNNYHEIDLDELPVEVVRALAKADNERITEKKPDQT